MTVRPRILAGALGAVGALLVAVGVVYLVVACQDLPGILGPTAGDTSPRTPRGVAGVVLGVALLAVALLAARRRPPSGPAKP